MDTKTCLVALCLVPGVGGVTLRALLDRFKSVEAVLEAPEDELQSVPGVGPRIAAGIRAINVEHTEAEIETWCMDQIGILAWDEPAYPIRLRDLHDAPPILFCRGTLNGNDARAVSIVGTRSPSLASRTLAEQLAAELARRGWTIVSGLAWGVDFAAHEGALRNGRTIAVLGSGLRAALPSARHALAARILDQGQGALLSETHPDADPSPAALVARNRLIAGLSRAVIVIEAGMESGSLYAAKQALKQGRTLFAVQNGSAGNAALIADKSAYPLEANFADWDRLDDLLTRL